MDRRPTRIAAAILTVLAAAGAAASGAGPAAAEFAIGSPERIVSLNMCTDELLLRLVPTERIASVTWLSQDPRAANMAEAARRVPANHGLAEEVLAFRPDLVVAGRYTTRVTVALLRRAGLRVVDFDVPNDLAAVYGQIRAFGALVGEGARAEAHVGDMELRLARMEATADRPRAFVLRPNGFTAGRGSLVDAILTRAGLDNVAARLDLGNYGQVPLETVVIEGAELLIVDGERAGPASLATALLDHPVLTKLRRRVRGVALPSRFWNCAGPAVVDAVEHLREAARTAGARP